MSDEIYSLLIQIIKDNCSWIRLADSERIRKRYVWLCDCTRTLMSRSLTFEACLRIGGYQKGHVWHVSEDDISKAILKLRVEKPSFARRVDRLELSAKDVQTVIEMASHGILKLNLYDEYSASSGESAR